MINRKPVDDSNEPEQAEIDRKLVPTTDAEKDALQGILQIFLKSAHVDFSHYRQTTILRRIYRRMSLADKVTYTDYLNYLENNAVEVDNLYDDLLLSHTEFFRDSAAFESIKKDVFPKLVAARPVKAPIRVWIAGCSSGEEVYSLAISLHEYLSEHKLNISVQFFGTDINQRHINRARRGLYTDKILKTVSPERLSRYFDKTTDGFIVTKEIREMCVFATQDMTQDPPFPSIDLISCRNVLIYFDSTLQESVIPLFHFALKANGFLLLGSSESMGKFTDLFMPVNEKVNLYVKRFSRKKAHYRFPVSQLSSRLRADHPSASLPVLSKAPVECADITRSVDALLIEHFTPPSIVIDSNMNIRQFRGDASRYLTPAQGEASLRLSKMANEELMPDIYLAVEEAKKKNCPVVKANLAFRQKDNRESLSITVLPVEDPVTYEKCFVIAFTASAAPYTTFPDFGQVSSAGGSLQLKLEEELHSLKEHLQAIVEEKDEVNQELWAANEEIQSTNEELQSVNEEMEAAKEELEASNEELVTLNEELSVKNAELRQSEDSLKRKNNLLSSLLENLPMGVFMVEAPTGKPLIANKVATELLGRGILPDVNKTNISEIYQAYKAYKNIPYPAEEMPIIRGMSGEVSHISDMEIIRPDGAKTILEVFGSPVKDEEGNVWASLVSFFDIKERKRMEEELRKSQKLESLGILAGGIAHDFNNLLAGIFGYIDAASRKVSDKTVSELMHKALGTMDRARSLTGQLLTFSKGGAPSQHSGSLFPFIEEGVRFALSGSNVRCRFDVSADLWNCRFDRGQIGQAVDNLVINALQAMPSGGILTITAQNILIERGRHPILTAGRYVRLSVIDNGSGIQKDIIDRIFDPFFTTKPNRHGLGLSTAFSIITRHNGAIDVESELNKGSSFHVYLPACQENVSLENFEINAAGKKGTILFMDDEPFMREIVSEVLQNAGYGVICKVNGDEVVEFFSSGAFKNETNLTALILDLTVPGSMGGIEAAERVRKMGIRLPIFVASGYANDPVMAAPQDYGFTASISKPFMRDELLSFLAKYITDL